MTVKLCILHYFFTKTDLNKNGNPLYMMQLKNYNNICATDMLELVLDRP